MTIISWQIWISYRNTSLLFPFRIFQGNVCLITGCKIPQVQSPKANSHYTLHDIRAKLDIGDMACLFVLNSPDLDHGHFRSYM